MRLLAVVSFCTEGEGFRFGDVAGSAKGNCIGCFEAL